MLGVERRRPPTGLPGTGSGGSFPGGQWPMTALVIALGAVGFGGAYLVHRWRRR
ncbi:MAG: hypothetical protein IVW36_11330 [Dehalococcoidia bacterium]|nr:hypothetical protein [Dehalococcoidia bacterium]